LFSHTGDKPSETHINALAACNITFYITAKQKAVWERERGRERERERKREGGYSIVSSHIRRTHISAALGGW